MNHSSCGESGEDVAGALMFVCEGEDPTDPRWRTRVGSRLRLMLEDSSALLVPPQSASLETTARWLSSRMPTELHVNYCEKRESERKRDLKKKNDQVCGMSY